MPNRRPGHPEGKPAEQLPIIALAAPAGKDGEPSEPFEVIRAGKFVRGGRTIELTDSDLDRMVDNFNRWRELGAEVPVDYDHSFHEGGESRAAGWFTELVKRGKSLFARVRWTPEGAAKIASREYRFFSPEWTHDWVNEEGRSEGPTMQAGGLTNRPFLRGMTPVALSRDAAAAAFAALGPDDLAAADETRPEVSDGNDNKPEGDKPNGDQPGDEGKQPETPAEGTEGKQPEGEAAAAAGDGKPAEGKQPETETASQARDETVTMSRKDVDELKAKAKAHDELEDKVETMSTELARETKQLATERFERDFKLAQDEGRVDAKPETREAWAKRYERYGRDEAKDLLFERPATIPVEERGRGGDGDQPAAPEGQDAEAFSTDRKVKAYMAEHDDVTYTEALEKIEAAEGVGV